jgi:prepilin-type processing-associated H-X9-DG protein
LYTMAADRKSTGHSYEQYGWWYSGSSEGEQMKTESRVLTHKDVNPTSIVGPNGVVPGPAGVVLLRDGDDRITGTPGTVNLNDYPDIYDNHGDIGSSILFADGHAGFVPRKATDKRKSYRWIYQLGVDEDGIARWGWPAND